MCVSEISSVNKEYSNCLLSFEQTREKVRCAVPSLVMTISRQIYFTCFICDGVLSLREVREERAIMRLQTETGKADLSCKVA